MHSVVSIRTIDHDTCSWHEKVEKLYAIQTKHGLIEVEKKADRLIYRQNGFVNQTEINDNGDSTGYITLMYDYIKRKKCHKVLVLGCGGGALPTMLTQYPTYCKVTVVDICPESFDIARKYFHMPYGVRCITSDAVDFILSNKEKFDCIVLDCYDLNAKPPIGFFEDYFAKALKGSLNDKGMVLINTIQSKSIAMPLSRAGFKSTIVYHDIAHGIIVSNLP